MNTTFLIAFAAVQCGLLAILAVLRMQRMEAEQRPSLRDQLAAKAMQAFVSGHIAHYGHENYWKPSDMAGEAYGVADAMLEARSS